MTLERHGEMTANALAARLGLSQPAASGAIESFQRAPGHAYFRLVAFMPGATGRCGSWASPRQVLGLRLILGACSILRLPGRPSGRFGQPTRR